MPRATSCILYLFATYLLSLSLIFTSILAQCPHFEQLSQISPRTGKSGLGSSSTSPFPSPLHVLPAGICLGYLWQY